MSEYTRVTVQGQSRKADLVLPDDEPIAAVLPDVLALLNESTERSARPLVLVTSVGEQLAPGLTLAEQNVDHGTILRLVRIDEAPPPPEVADVTDILGEAVENRADAWRPMWATAAAAAVAAVAAALSSSAMVEQGMSVTQVAIMLGTLAVFAIIAARRDRAQAATVLLVAAAGWATTVAAGVATTLGLTYPFATAVTWFGMSCAIAALVAIAGFQDRPLALGGTLGTVILGGWTLMLYLDLPIAQAAGIVAAACALLLGLLPGIAMSISGLTGLDDRVVEGNRIASTTVADAVDQAHRSLSWATVAVAAPASFTAWVLSGIDEWAAQGLAAAVAAILLLRTQVLPLAPQRLVLIAAGVAPLLALIYRSGLMTTTQAAVAGVVLLTLAGLMVAVRTSENTRARLRRLAGFFELIAVLTLVPFVLQLFGVFADLLEQFR